MSISFFRLVRSFRYAVRGIRTAFRTEQNLRIQSIALVAVFALAIFLELPILHIAFLVLVSTFVLVLELINTAWEHTVDLLHPRLSPTVRDMKDLLSGMVLVASVGALIVGLLILGPPLFSLLYTKA